MTSFRTQPATLETGSTQYTNLRAAAEAIATQVERLRLPWEVYGVLGTQIAGDAYEQQRASRQEACTALAQFLESVSTGLQHTAADYRGVDDALADGLSTAASALGGS